MSISDYIKSIFKRGGSDIPTGKNQFFLVGGGTITKLPFADVVYNNAVHLVTSLCNDVTFTATQSALFDAFAEFYRLNGQRVSDLLFRDGVVVIGHQQIGDGVFAAHNLRVLQNTEYIVQTTPQGYHVSSAKPDTEVYAMRTATFELEGKSDKAVLQSWLNYIDNVMNASNTISERLGSLIVASPETPAGMPPVSLNEFERKDIEKEISENYGALNDQSQWFIMNTPMKLTTINMAGLDQRTEQKLRLGCIAIADHFQLPSNQVGLIDATQSKAFANGSELREGDFMKYQTFERFLDRTWVRLAKDMGLSTITYDIYNKPKREVLNG